MLQVAEYMKLSPRTIERKMKDFGYATNDKKIVKASSGNE